MVASMTIESVMADNKNLGIVLAMTAGVMAALGSTCAKLAMTAEKVESICTDIAAKILDDGRNAELVCGSLSYVLRAACFITTFLFNAIMWTFYTKSLQHCTSTVEATITNTGSNFLFTAVIGLLLFGESLSLFWWCGSCLILGGLILIHKGSSETKEVLEQKVK